MISEDLTIKKVTNDYSVHDFLNELVHHHKREIEKQLEHYNRNNYEKGWLNKVLHKFVFDKFFKAKRSKKYSTKRKYSESDLKNRLRMFHSGLQGVWGVPGKRREVQ